MITIISVTSATMFLSIVSMMWISTLVQFPCFTVIVLMILPLITFSSPAINSSMTPFITYSTVVLELTAYPISALPLIKLPADIAPACLTRSLTSTMLAFMSSPTATSTFHFERLRLLQYYAPIP